VKIRIILQALQQHVAACETQTPEFIRRSSEEYAKQVQLMQFSEKIMTNPRRQFGIWLMTSFADSDYRPSCQ
jgi:hypothetical protein